MRYSPLRGELGQLAYMSYIFSLRLPSETLQLVWALSNGPITEYKKHDTNALIGVRTYNNTALLVAKFAFRKTSTTDVYPNDLVFAMILINQ